MSATHSRSGRSTRSGAGRAFGSRRVVRGPLQRLTPASPVSRITKRACNASGTEPPACGSPACPVRQAPRECAAHRTCHGCAGESLAHAHSAPRQSVFVPSADGCVVPVRGDTEDKGSSRSERNFGGHCGDSDFGLMLSHEPVDLPGTVSRANQTVAFARMSRSSRSRRISRRRRRSSSYSAVLGPVAATPLVTLSLHHPVADRLRGRLELPCQLLRRATSSNQLNHLAPVLRRVWRS